MVENKKPQIAIFDFCGTFIPFQSADAFVRYCLEKENKLFLFQKADKKIALLRKLRIIQLYFLIFRCALQKKIYAKLLKGIPFSKAEAYAESFIKEKINPALIKKTQELFFQQREAGVYPVFVSAAYNTYLEKFAGNLGFFACLSTKLIVNKNGILTGRIYKDCVGKRKVIVVKKYLDKKFGKNNYDIIFSISDSRGDIPILDIAKRKVVVSSSHQDWVKKDYEEHIYEAC